jgi:hypothetical protein
MRDLLRRIPPILRRPQKKVENAAGTVTNVPGTVVDV